ncbi:phospholipase D-like domain-containing protein [Peredibacter sp. HCB2-198]|uniref:phospholipase D-like domain-containing protein n=1 Tax=Peredibacter sp. HCB2-198 TaxID=3383025 RepID=UPI0038B521C4
MKYWQLLTLGLVISTSAFGSVSAYFNQKTSTRYTDPYRNITRNGDNLEAVIIDQIASAKKSIYVAVQEIRLPLIAQALINKKKQGVDVRLVIENNYNFDVTSQRDSTEDNEHEASRVNDLVAFVDANRNGRIEKNELETRDAIYMLRAAQVPIMDDTFDASRGSGLMHHKFIIVDGKSTVVSTANFTMSCIHGDVLAPQSRGNANSMIVVQSPQFAQIFTQEFAQLWGNGRHGNFGQNKAYRPPQTVVVRGVKLTVQFSPTSARFNWEDSVNGLIAKVLSRSTQSIKAALFVFSDQRLADIMERRHDAGVNIGVIIQPSFAFREYSELLDLMGIGLLNSKCEYEPDNNPWRNPVQEAGYANLPKGDMLHHKFAVVDRRAVVVGSQNWSEAANYINDETLVVVEGIGIAEQYAREYDRIKQSASLGPNSWLVQQVKRTEASCAGKGLYF